MIWAFPPGTPVFVTKLPKRAMHGTYLKKCIPPIPFPTPKQVVKKKIGIIHQDGCARVHQANNLDLCLDLGFFSQK